MGSPCPDARPRVAPPGIGPPAAWPGGGGWISRSGRWKKRRKPRIGELIRLFSRCAGERLQGRARPDTIALLEPSQSSAAAPGAARADDGAPGGSPQAPQVPDRPSLDGLEEKWNAVWEQN